jgi:putative ABC transport system permease protein
MNDLKFAVRQLLKNPGFTAVAVVTLALGIGANTAIFSVLNTVLLKPLPYRHADRIVMIWTDNPSYNLGFHELPPSQQDLMDWRAQAKSFDQIAAISSATIDLKRADDSRRLGAVSVTANLFEALGIQPMLGRTFTAEEEQPGKDKVAILGHALWQREFGGDPKILGTSISLNNERRSVVGIMPPGFSFPHGVEMPPPYHLAAETELWLPASGDAAFWADDVNRQFIVLGRLRPEVTVKQAQVEMSAIAQRVAKERAATHAGWSTNLRPLPIQVAGPARPLLFVLFASVVFVLLIASANVANLLLCRGAARQKELAIRAAIGAGRARVFRQLLTESLVLAAIGGTTGVLLGVLGLKALLAFSPSNIPRLHETVLDGKVLAFCAALSLVTGIVFGLVPAWSASRLNLSEFLNSSDRGNSASSKLVRFGTLVTAETAIAVILLTGAMLTLQAFEKLLKLDPGFAKSGVGALDLTFRGPRYDSGEARIAFFDQLQEQLRAVPGVRAAGAISHLPLGGHENVGYFRLEGAAEPEPGKEPLAEDRLVTSGAFEAMGFKLVQGREFEKGDALGKIPVTVINQALAHQFFPGASPLGKRIRRKEDKEWLTIIGVIADVHGAALELRPRPAMYRAHRQSPGYWDEMTVVMRTGPDAAAMSPEQLLRREIRKLDPSLSIANFRTIESLVAQSLARPRFTAFLLAVFATVALVLTMVGLYGVVAYTVNRRTRELGIRVALGAGRFDVMGLVLKQGLRPALLGIVIGIAGAAGLTRFLASQLYGVDPMDPLTFAGVCIVLIVIAGAACWLPARRAARVHPMIALRYE